ncbi:ATP-binding protein [Pseudooceanicola sp. C21-150M6]|uniref:ATP-binding protein n=1 Tax=Pseudooceanicola sp. C21-150M6 TaxID=3434355 RepID=UPI003D7F57C3
MPVERHHIQQSAFRLPQPAAAVSGSIALDARALAVRHALAEFIDRLRDATLEQEQLGTIELVLAEVLNNVVEHAYTDTGGHIGLHWSLGETGLLIRVEDSGRAMPGDILKMTRRSAQDLRAPVISEGGYGWFLIDRLARNIVYRREGDRNILTFRICLG